MSKVIILLLKSHAGFLKPAILPLQKKKNQQTES